MGYGPELWVLRKRYLSKKRTKAQDGGRPRREEGGRKTRQENKQYPPRKRLFVAILDTCRPTWALAVLLTRARAPSPFVLISYKMKRKRGTSSKRVYRKKRRVSRKLSRVVKSIVMKNEETKKSGMYKSGTLAVTVGGLSPLTTHNIMYNCVEHGSRQDQFIGNQLHLKGFKVKFNLANIPATEGITVTYGIIKCRTYATTSNLDLSDIYYDGGATGFKQDPILGIVDSSKAKWLWRKTQSIVPNLSGQVMNKYSSAYVRVNKRVRFTDFDISYQLTGWNYYLVCSAVAASSTNINVANWNANLVMYYKDA